MLGREIYAPSGSVRIAQRMGVPIVAGIAIREGASYRIVFRQLDGSLPYWEVMQSYFDLLAEILPENPGLWDGWDWFGNLPPAEQSGDDGRGMI